jgi:hypothetical protein
MICINAKASSIRIVDTLVKVINYVQHLEGWVDVDTYRTYFNTVDTICHQLLPYVHIRNRMENIFAV